MREIVLDTETTGLDPLGGDRIVEIGCVELVNHVATGGELRHSSASERAEFTRRAGEMFQLIATTSEFQFA